MVTADPTATANRHRVILLGASNLTLGLAVIVDTIREHCPAPVEIYSAHGLGRSYGAPSTVLGRSLPSVLHSELWQVISDRPALPTTALITDVGNDVLYQVPPEQIADWVSQCIDRLHALDAHVSMTLLPVCNLEHLGKARFYLFRTLFFPTCRLSYDEVCRRAEHLNRLLMQLAADRKIRAVEPMTGWYTFDAIHVTPRKWHTAWPAFLDPMVCHVRQQSDGALQTARVALTKTAVEVAQSAWWMLKPPSQRWLLGIEQHGRQPSIRYADGTTVAFH